MMRTECNPESQGAAFVRLPLRGQRRLKIAALANRLAGAYGVDFILLPVELQGVNHTASTNRQDSTRQNTVNPTIKTAMPNQTQVAQIDQITERVEQLLLRYEELLRSNAQLVEQVSALTHERDSLRSRLSAARARVDALIERLPESAEPVANTPVDPAR